MKLINKWVVTSLVIVAMGYITPGIIIKDFYVALVAAIILGLINAIIRPIILILTIPINIFTLGLFTFVINAGLVMFSASLVAGFEITNFWWALLLSLILSVVNMLRGK